MFYDSEKLFVYNQLKLLLNENQVISYELDRLFGRSNLAYFIDCNINTDNWEELLGTIKDLATSVHTVNELSYLIASTNIQYWSQEVSKNKSSEEAKHLAKIGACMLAPYTDKFTKGTLKEFSIIGIYPQWFVDYELQNISNTCKAANNLQQEAQPHNPKVKAFHDLILMFSANESFSFISNNKDNEANIAYLVDCYHGSEDWYSLYTNISYLIQTNSVNDLCLLLCEALAIAFVNDESAITTENNLNDDILDIMSKNFENCEADYKAGTLKNIAVIGSCFYPKWYTELYN